MKRTPVCALTGEPSSFVNERYCQGFRPPEIEEKICNENCSLNWISEYTSQCSSLCGLGQRQQHSVCFKILSSGEKQRLPEEYCSHLEKPPSAVRCFNDCEGRRWIYSNWSPCSATCGDGVQKRSKHCVDSRNNVLDDRYCENIISESNEQKCGEILCPFWHYDEWERVNALYPAEEEYNSDMRFVLINPEVKSTIVYVTRLKSLIEGVAMGSYVLSGISVLGEFTLERHTTAIFLESGFKRMLIYCIDVFTYWSVNLQDCGVSSEMAASSWGSLIPGVYILQPKVKCSATCGIGTAKRDAHCIDTMGNIIDDAYCIVEQKIVSKQCDNVRCPHWLLSEWSPCSKTCLDGWSSRRITCVDGYDREIDSAYCQTTDSENSGPPASHKPCHLGSCPFWRAHDWSSVSSISCGSGQQQRLIECVNNDEVVDSSFCHSATQPERQRICHLIHCPIWTYGAWESALSRKPGAEKTLCSVSCGTPGVQRRLVQCVYPDSSIVTDAIACNVAKKPKDVKKCKKPCNEFIGHISETYGYHIPSNGEEKSSEKTVILFGQHNKEMQQSPVKWETGSWTECSVTCGDGIRRRYVACRDVYNRILTDLYCSFQKRPIEQEVCSASLCHGIWLSDKWNPCSSTCGRNLKRSRTVKCVDVRNQSLILPETRCAYIVKPPFESPCEIKDCPADRIIAKVDMNLNFWRVGEWGQCSKSCGKGVQKRLVTCRVSMAAKGRISAGVNCPTSQKPQNIRPCENYVSECYVWTPSAWSECNQTCGGGFQVRAVHCLRSPDNQIVGQNYCQNPIPAHSQLCYREPCRRKYVWKAGRWSACSVTCGRGKRFRNVQCVDRGNITFVQSDSFCFQLTKPGVVQRCRLSTVCPRWKFGPWSSCSATCGQGRKSRPVTCYWNHTEATNDQICSHAPKPADVTLCIESVLCPSYKWKHGLWSKCSSVCGSGQQRREIKCVSDYGKKAPFGQCSSQMKPESFRNCTSTDCPYMWVPGAWTTCSKSCGVGEQFRGFKCQVKPSSPIFASNIALKANKDGVRVPDYLCHGLEKVPARRSCTMGICGTPYIWKTDVNWSKCSATCGYGIQYRQVYCINHSENRVDRALCDIESKPKRKKRCLLRNCK
uniref:Uncharacterized protein n=1 Tax=Romanomermis culicivorax TaxID=13658 RepID=A0A915JT12_ROMCU